jgi:hypothetical protein
MTVTKRNSSPGRARRKPLKPFACGNAGLFRWTCGDDRVPTTTNAHGLRAHWAPGIPHALFGRKFLAQLGRIAPRECEAAFDAVIARSKRRPFYACCASFAGRESAEAPEREGGSNPLFLCVAMDCFASLAMTAPHTQLSSPGLTGRPSIPETVVIEPKGRGVLGPRIRGGDEFSWGGLRARHLRGQVNVTSTSPNPCSSIRT